MLIETERLALRQFTIDDLDAFALLMADPEVMRFSPSGPVTDMKKVKEYFQKRILDHYIQYGYGLYAVIEKKDNQLIGFVGLINQNIEGESKTELAYRLLPQFWGKGLATEACLAIGHYAFNQLGMDEVISIIDSKNTRSLQVAKRIGMYHWKNALFHHLPVEIYGLKKLILEPFQQNWHSDFEKEKIKLLNSLEGLDIEFYHIGSTAIPQSAAKPIIDILGVTPDITIIDQYSELISELGYQAMGENGMKQRRFFRRKHHDPVHLHIFEDSDPEVERHLRFVSYLTAHPKLLKEYSEIKHELAQQFPGNSERYCLGKERFIKTVDAMAAKEASTLILPTRKVHKKKVWSSFEILKAMETNLHLQMTYFTKYVDTMELLSHPDATVVRSCIADDTFNYVLSAGFNEANVQDRVSQIIKLFKDPAIPYSWWVGPYDTPKALADVLIAQGLHLKEENAGMYLSIDDFIPSPSNSPLDFQKAHSLQQLKDFSQVFVSVGGHPEAFDKIFSRVPPILYQDGTCYEIYVAYLHGIPIVTGILVLHANVGGIYYIATVPDQRKKGYGTAMMEYLIQRAKDQGYHLITLQASKEGKPLYQHLGFKECCVFKEYAKTPV